VNMPLRDRRQSMLKPILGLAILAALLAICARVFPIYSRSSQLADYIRDRAVRESAANASPQEVQREVVAYARGLNLPLSPEEVRVTSDSGTLSIKLDYKVPVDLAVTTWNLHFTPSVISRAY
jgi:hypothetical protein